MKIKAKYLEFCAEICVKIFQIIFAMMVIGLLLREKFNAVLFISGMIGSLLVLSTALVLYYQGSVKEED